MQLFPYALSHTHLKTKSIKPKTQTSKYGDFKRFFSAFFHHLKHQSQLCNTKVSKSRQVIKQHPCSGQYSSTRCTGLHKSWALTTGRNGVISCAESTTCRMLQLPLFLLPRVSFWMFYPADNGSHRNA